MSGPSSDLSVTPARLQLAKAIDARVTAYLRSEGDISGAVATLLTGAASVVAVESEARGADRATVEASARAFGQMFAATILTAFDALPAESTQGRAER